MKESKTIGRKAVLATIFLLASHAASADVPSATPTHDAGWSQAAPWLGMDGPALVDDGHDVQITVVVDHEVGMRCDTCNTTQSLINAALSRFPRAQRTNVYGINARTGTVVGIYLNHLGPGELDHHEFAVDPLVRQWVADVGAVYRANGYSLNLKLVGRADGSMYWVRANGTREELKDPDPRLDSGFTPMDNGNGVNDELPNSSPIDLRGYQFPSNFFTQYPAYPRSSYDFAFASTPSVNGFVRDQTAGIQYGPATGVINGTVTATGPDGGLTTPIASLTGGISVSSNLTSSISVNVPMPDGGFAIVSYDKRTGVITLLQLEDGQGASLPTNRPRAEEYLPGNPFHFADTAQGHSSLDSFRDWALRHGIPVTGATPWDAGTGGRVCVYDVNDHGRTVVCTRDD